MTAQFPHCTHSIDLNLVGGLKNCYPYKHTEGQWLEWLGVQGVVL